jgi:quercetin dioxygenase-like cupin family protein
MLVRNNMSSGWKGARHSHPHHQIVYIVRGHICFQAEGKSWDLHAGDSVVVDGNVEHEASAFEDSEVLDIFTPCREDYA